MSIGCLKALLVIKGFTQVPCIDFTKTFNPLIKHITIWMVLALAVKLKWTLKEFDVQKAFLHGYLKEVFYMEQLLGFTDPTYPSYVCKLRKSLY